MKRSSLTAFTLAIGVCAQTYAIQITENFDTDPAARGWGGVANTTAPNNYGFSNTDNTGSDVSPPGGTATAAGEVGGVINRGPNSFYGVNLGGAVDFATNDMNVKGVLRLTAHGFATTLNLGWSQGITSVNGSSSLYMTWDDGIFGLLDNGGGLRARKADGNGIGSADGPSLPDPDTTDPTPTLPFEMDWDSATRTFTLDVNGDIGTLVMSDGELAQLPQLTHWGMWSRNNAPPAEANTLWIDDLTYTAVSAVTPGVPGDYNNNGTVDAADYSLWKKGGPILNEGEDVSTGVVDIEDYNFWKSQFGNPPAAEPAAGSVVGPVPEPASILLALAALAMWLPRRSLRPTLIRTSP